MAEDRAEIQIILTADQTGAKQTVNAMQDVQAAGTKANEELTKSGEKAEISHRALRLGLRQLNSDLAEAGHLALTAFANPLTAAFIAVSFTLGEIIKKSQEANAEAMASADEIASSFIKSAEAARELSNESAKAEKAFEDELTALHTAQTSVESVTDRNIQKIKQQGDAIKKLMEVAKEYELSQAKPEDKEAIERRYKTGRENVDLAEQRRLLEARNQEVAEAYRRAPALQAELKAAEQDAGDGLNNVRGDLGLREKDKERLEKQVKEAREKYDKGDKSGKAERELGIAEKSLQDTLRIMGEDQAKIDAANGRVNKARGSILQNQKIIETVGPTIPGLKAGVATAENLATIDQSGIGGAITAGAAAMHALQEHHGKVSELDAGQVAAIKNLTSMLNKIHANNSTMLGLITASDGKADELAARIRTIETRMRSLEGSRKANPPGI